MNTIFDQKGQHISGSQYNVAGNAEFSIQSREINNFGEHLQKIKHDIDDLRQRGDITPGDANIVVNCIDQAIDTHSRSADSGKIKNYLEMASNILQNIIAASGLVTTINQLIKTLGAG